MSAARCWAIAAQPVTELRDCRAKVVLTIAFDAARFIDQSGICCRRAPKPCRLDAMRMPDALLGNRARYLDPLNFATNFVFFREADGLSTRLVTANYWVGLWRAGDGAVVPPHRRRGCRARRMARGAAAGKGAIMIDSRAVRRRFGLPEFTGQLFLHVIGAEGHDVVKYALDIVGRRERTRRSLRRTTPIPGRPISMPACRRRAPARPSRCGCRTASPAPFRRARSGSISWATTRCGTSTRAIAPFATCALDVASAPARGALAAADRGARRQIFRAAALRGERAARARRIAHVNVERTDLQPDPKLAELGNLLGKGYLLPAPILPRGELPHHRAADADGDDAAGAADGAGVYDRDGREAARSMLRPAAARRKRRDSISTTMLERRRAAGRLRPSRADLRFQRRRRGRRLAARAVPLSSIAPAATRPRPASARMSSTPC